MKTRVPEKRDVPAVEPQDDGLVRQVRHYKLITPLFGGGVTPGAADPITIVRGTEVRGQLRFWWRATRGGQFDGDLEKMRRREEKIWGSAAAKDKPGPSVVHIAVKTLAEGTLDRPFEVIASASGQPRPRARKGSSAPAYAAFPLQPEKTEATIGMQTAAVRVGVEFSLEVRYPKCVQADVRAALWAWETFGGLGARTRRGFGALQRVGREVVIADLIKPFVLEGVRGYVVSGVWPAGVPHLSQDPACYVTLEAVGDPLLVWSSMIEELRVFRQDRHPGKDHSGRSKWPEPDEVRRLLGTHDPKHVPWHKVRAFPRGQFGLPIMFHFKDQRGGDPTDSMLRGGENDRFASALILRPLACSGGAVGLAVRLVSPESPPGGYVLVHSGSATSTVEVTGLSAEDAQLIEPLGGDPDVIRAFLRSLKGNAKLRRSK